MQQRYSPQAGGAGKGDQQPILPAEDPTNEEKEKEETPSKTTCCGLPRKTCVLVWFLASIFLILLGYFLWPRQPYVKLAGIYQNSTISPHFDLGIPNKYYFHAGYFANFSIVNNDNYIPWADVVVNATVRHLTTSMDLGKGTSAHFRLPTGMTFTDITVPFNVTYKTANLTDPTLRSLVAACSGEKPPLSIRFIIMAKVAGLSWITKPTMEFPAVVACPSGLPKTQDPFSDEVVG